MIWDTSAAYNDLLSWNFELEVFCDNNLWAAAYDEFGISQYTSLSAGDVSATGMPGWVVE